MPKLKKYDDEKVAQELAEKVQDLPDNWLMCRDVRHAWQVTDDFHVTKTAGSKVQEIRRILTCDRCGGQRHERYHASKWGLEKIGQSYSYPEGYQIHGVPRGVKPSFIVQGEQYRRVLDKLAKASKKKAS